ncbi:MAG: YncE family protein [Bryobacteraceae bacterium]
MASIIGVPSWTFGADHGGAKAYSIDKTQVGELAAVDQGRAIFKMGDKNIERLSIWDIGARRISTEVALRAWGQWSQRAPQSLQVGQDIFRIQRSGRKLVAVQAPWVVLIDLQKHIESRRVLTSEAYLDPNVTAPTRTDDLPERAVMAMNPVDDSVVIALNLNDETTLFLYSADLEPKARWSVPRYVRSLCWSPDGRTLAILYAGRYDDRRRPISVHFGEISPEPDVWLCDGATGKATAKFSTGSSENQILFRNDGKQLYAINTWMYRGGRMGWGMIRVFDIPSGTLLHTIRGPKHGIHGRMDLSTDGRFIAAVPVLSSKTHSEAFSASRQCTR